MGDFAQILSILQPTSNSSEGYYVFKSSNVSLLCHKLSLLLTQTLRKAMFICRQEKISCCVDWNLPRKIPLRKYNFLHLHTKMLKNSYLFGFIMVLCETSVKLQIPQEEKRKTDNSHTP